MRQGASLLSRALSACRPAAVASAPHDARLSHPADARCCSRVWSTRQCPTSEIACKSILVLEKLKKVQYLKKSPTLEHLHSRAQRGPRHPFFHPDGEKRSNRVPGSSISPGFGPSSIRRAQAIPGLLGRARGLRTKEMRAKRRGNFPRVMWPQLVGERGRSSSSLHRLPRIVIFPVHRLPRDVKATADGRPATRQSELMRGRLYIVAYRASGRPHSSASPQSTLHLLHLLQESNGRLRIR
jgi:hypothetical protein